MRSTLEAIQFFANSANSVRVIEALADGSTTSSELADRTGASRSTVPRILDEGESRGWIESEGSRYELTVTGEILIDEFRAQIETVEAIQHLGEAVEWLPPPARSIDFRDLRETDITRSTTDNPAAPFDRGIELIRTAGEFLGLTSMAIPRYTRIIRDRFVEGQMDGEAVIEASFIETLRADPERAVTWYDLADTGTTSVYDGHVPINMHVVDDVVLLWLGNRDEAALEIYGLMESGNRSVLAWARSTYEEYRAEAKPLDPEMLP